MALSDIISRIEADASAEEARIVGNAEARAATVRDAADRAAEEAKAAILEDAEREAGRETSRVTVAARLGVRDEGLSGRHALLEEALHEIERRITELPIDAYADFLGERIASFAQGGEVLRFGSADVARRDAILGAVRRIRPGLELVLDDEPAPFERGALLQGDRVRVDLSLAALIDERREELVAVLISKLFGEEA